MTSTGAVKKVVERGVGIGVLAFIVVGPAFLTDYWVSFILTQTFLLGVAAASLIFLSAYGGMVSLAQTAIFGIAGFSLANIVTTDATGGLNLGWNPWLAVGLAILISTAVALVFGALASRSLGIYFLMITLAFGVIGFYFFLQVDKLSGRAGIPTIRTNAPALVGGPSADPARLYYIALVVAIVVYVVIRYVVRTPFGIALQGTRDDPVRMASLGYNVPLHRMLAFGLAGFFASLSGVLYAWWNDLMDPAAIDLNAIVSLLVVAVIGGLGRIEGAWLGAFAFILINNYVRDVEFPVLGGSFPTVIGFIFLAIVLVSPDGLMGLWDRLWDVVGGRRGPPPVSVEAQRPAAEPSSS
jgi:branched-chain amino acid transport system permease protein